MYPLLYICIPANTLHGNSYCFPFIVKYIKGVCDILKSAELT